jgi:hypothetical protein
MIEESPVIVGAVGGSGTRVVQQILSEIGCYMGTELNENGEPIPLQHFFRRYSSQSLRAWLSESPAPQAETPGWQEMTLAFRRAIEQHLAPCESPVPCWGFKVPKSILFLPFLVEQYPNLRFIHMIRNGLDMVYSKNWRLQEEKKVLLNAAQAATPVPEQSMILWQKVNQMAANFRERLGPNSICLRFEDLCTDPQKTLSTLFRFLGVSDARLLERCVKMVRQPDSLGRWRNAGLLEVWRIMQTGREGLTRFGYWNEPNWQEISRAAKSPFFGQWRFKRSRMKTLAPW